MYLNKLIQILLLFALTSCTNIVKNNENIPILKCTNCSEDPSDETPLYTDLQIIKLENNPSCLISYIKQIEMTDSLIFILDVDSHLYVFNKEGKFKYQVSKKGEAPSEYILLNTFYIDKNQQVITILDDYKRRLIMYDFEGNYKSSVSVPEGTLRNSTQALLSDDSTLMLNNMMDNADNMAYSLVDTKRHKLIGKYFSYAPISLSNYFYSFSNHPMTKTDDGIDFILPLCDTIYNYTSSSFSPKYIVETPQKMASKAQIKKNTQSYSSDLFDLTQEGYFPGFIAIYETDSKILLTFKYNGAVLGYFLFDKSSKQGKYYFYTFSYESEVLPFFYTMYATGNKFVGVETAKGFGDLKNVKNEEFQKILKEAKEDDNPYLFIYEME